MMITEPVSGRNREWRLGQKNVLSKMQRMLGPLGMLYGCMENRNRIRVGHIRPIFPKRRLTI